LKVERIFEEAVVKRHDQIIFQQKFKAIQRNIATTTTTKEI